MQRQRYSGRGAVPPKVSIRVVAVAPSNHLITRIVTLDPERRDREFPAPDERLRLLPV
jgi:hypothetical protein